MQIRKLKWVSVAVAAALTFCSAGAVCDAGGLTFRTPGVSGDTSSDGAVITVALFATACVVLVLLGLKADYENVFGEATPDEREAKEKAFQERVAAELQNPEYRNLCASPETEPDARLGLAWRVDF